MTQIECGIKFCAQYPLTAPDGNIGRGLRELNVALARGRTDGVLVEPFSEDEMLDIEASLIAARISGVEGAVEDARRSYVEKLRRKGVSEILLPS